MRENRYQAQIIKKLKSTFRGSFVLKNDSTYLQGVPDLIILYRDRWAALEVKANPTAEHRPNQDYYIELLGEMGYASFIFPEVEEEVFSELSRHFRSRSRNFVQALSQTIPR